MRALTVLYDAGCALCVRAADLLATSPAYVPIELVACASEEARERFGDVPWLGEELVAVSDDGDVWVGPAAFLVCLWALRDYREWAYRLSSEELAPLAERVLVAISARRKGLGAWLGPTRCDAGTCALPHATTSPHAPRGAYRGGP
ncbi:MAG: DUF393 domain-containing protein [Myxococcales bacterium]|nr:DUF393 domain-containing protein [Myxococcales bacterium]